MPTHSLSHLPAVAWAAVLATFAFTAPALGAPASGSAWTANGATACEKYLTPAVVAAILRNPAGKPRQVDAHTCNAGPIYINLTVADIDIFRAGTAEDFPSTPDRRHRRRRVLERGRRSLCCQGP